MWLKYPCQSLPYAQTIPDGQARCDDQEPTGETPASGPAHGGREGLTLHIDNLDICPVIHGDPGLFKDQLASHEQHGGLHDLGSSTRWLKNAVHG